jgi:ADP-heptose:LPS heptosyltransferase
MLARLLLAAEAALRGMKQPASAEVHQVLILEYQRPLGCCVHLTPLFETLKRCRPDMQLILAGQGLAIEVNRHSPFIDALIATPDPFTDLQAAVRSLRRQLHHRCYRPGCILTGASDQRTRLALLGLFSSSGWRGGFTIKPDLYHEPVAYDAALSLIQNNLRLAKLLGCSNAAARVCVPFSHDVLAAAKELIAQSNPDGRPLAVMVTQNSGGQSTGWHTDRWAAVIKAANALGCVVVYAGTKADQSAIAAIMESAGGIGVSIAGKTSVTQLAAVLALSDIAITLDTGTMHVGRAAGVPMVVLGPSWQKPLEWLPLGIENVRILRGVDRDDVPPGYRLDEITADSVIDSMNELLAKYPASAQQREMRVNSSLSEVDHLT